MVKYSASARNDGEITFGDISHYCHEQPLVRIGFKQPSGPVVDGLGSSEYNLHGFESRKLVRTTNLDSGIFAQKILLQKI